MHYGTSSFSYDSLNRLTSENLAGIGETTYTYDAVGNRTTLTTPSPQGGPDLVLSMLNIYWASYQDWLDHKLSVDYRITNSGPVTAYEAKATHAAATNGVYLVSETPVPLGDINEGAYSDFTLKYYIPSGVTSFQTTVYSSCAGSGGTDYYYPAKRDFYSYNQANQLTEILNHDGETTAFSYDAGGAITEEATGPETTTYSYSGLDRLTGVTTPATTINYAYDALGRRIERSEEADTRSYHLYRDTDLTEYQTDSEGTLILLSQRGADGLISTTDYSSQEPTTSYYLYNPHGDTTAIANEAGTVTSTYRYDSFGSELSGDSPDYGYTGKWQRSYDTETETIQMGAREYDPALGRFVSADPLKGAPLDPQQRNRYQYTGNNPLTRYDLSGYSWVSDWISSLQSEGTHLSYSDQPRTRVGADGNGEKTCGCKLSGRTSLNPALMPKVGTGIQVGMFKYNEIDDYQDDYRLYEVTDVSGNTMTVPAKNPYLEPFALNVKKAGISGNMTLLSGFSSWFTGSLFMDIISGFKDPGAETTSELANRASAYFVLMLRWEEKCN